jgi:ubiquinone/menaquinone biosynthesis C-methylase UbiE
MLTWIIFAFVLIIAFALLHREVFYYDGAHLGPRIQAWLYTIWAAKYDFDKRETQAKDAELLIHPLLERLGAGSARSTDIRVLDVATGTGRFPYALFQSPEFAGRVVALDISSGMLKRAAQKLAPYQERRVLVQYLTLPLPFADKTFDVVCCVEALELMPDMEGVLGELARVVKPGGVLVTSRCTKAWGNKLKLRGPEEFAGLLQRVGFEQIEHSPWWDWFDRVFAKRVHGWHGSH